MDSNQIFALGLGLTPPWKLVGQHLDTKKNPHELHLRLQADRGSLFPCPEYGCGGFIAYYVQRSLNNLDLRSLEAFALDETASKRGITTSPYSLTLSGTASRSSLQPPAGEKRRLPFADGKLTDEQVEAIAELEVEGLHTAKAWRVKEMLRWVNRAPSLRAASGA